MGTPAAYLLATRSFRGRALVVTLVELPLVLPPAVAGIALLAALGPKGILGGALDSAGIELALATAGVVVALTFVASPFYVRQGMAAFAAVDRHPARRLAHARGLRGARLLAGGHPGRHARAHRGRGARPRAARSGSSEPR